MPYDFPSGHGLLTRVCGTLLTDKGQPKDVLSACGFDPDHIDSFRFSLCRSGRGSVDAFLEQRQEFIEVGKAAIAATLIPYEDDIGLMLPGRANNWYQYLWSQIGASWESFGSNRLSIITYNYDRSLEWYLFNCLKNSFGKPDADCVEKLRQIPILHVHGLLGELLIPNITGGRAYENKLDARRVGVAARGIRIVHEKVEDDPVFREAKQRLVDAKVICFLGFGYHSLNLERLGISQLRSDRTVCGTVQGLKQAELLQLSKDIGYPLDFADDAEILDYLRSRSVFSLSR